MHISLSNLLQLRINIFLYLIFGWKIARIFIFFLGRLYFYFNRKKENLIENAIFEVIGYRGQVTDIKGIIKKVFDGILSHYYEKLFVAFEKPGKVTKFLNHNIISDDLKVLYRILAKGNSAIVVTGHYGAIEYIPTLLAVKNISISMIAKFKTEQLKKKVFSQAKKYNIRLIDSEGTGNVIRSAIKELKENRILVTQCDEIEEWRPSEKKKMSFLGQVTGVDRTINIIQKRTGTEIVFGIIHRYNLNKYKLIMYAYEDMLQILNVTRPSSIGETVLKFLERHIYSNPEQWYQWEKYYFITNVTANNKRVKRKTSAPLLKPVFGRVA